MDCIIKKLKIQKMTIIYVVTSLWLDSVSLKNGMEGLRIRAQETSSPVFAQQAVPE